MDVTPRSAFDRFIARSAFPAVLDVAANESKVNAARIAVGAIMFYRTALIVAATYYYHPTDAFEGQISAKFLLGCGMLLLLFLYTTGFCTPLIGLMLIAAYPYFDARLLTGTLGTNVASMCLITLLLLNAGQRYSIDARILRGSNPLATTWRTMYRVVGSPDAVQATRIYFLAFTAYAIISFSALFYHLNDEYWRHGRTVGIMLTDAYLSRFYEAFRSWEAASPTLYRVFSAMCVAGQTFFQAAMFPLMFFVLGRRFVVVWGLVFFFISLVCLQLSYLPYLELVLWFMLFAAIRQQPASDSEQVSAQRASTVTAYSAAIAVAFTVFLLTWFAPGGRAWSGSAWNRPQRVLAWGGLDAPQVFNEADLRMGERWPLIERIDASGKRERIPFNGDDGERLAYHRSDLLYFGNSLRWRRRMIASDPRRYNAPGNTGYEQIREVCSYDYARSGLIEPVRYEVQIYENQAARWDLPPEQRYAAAPLLHFEFVVEPKRNDGQT